MITTVMGDKPIERFKNILPHEHIFSDLRALVSPLDDEDFYEDVKLSNFGKLTRNPYAILDNARLDNMDIQVDELIEYKKAGGTLLVDVTTKDFGRDPEMLLEASKRSGVDVVAGCGHYIDVAVDEKFKTLSKEEIRDSILKDIFEGIDGTDIKAGVIGEIGTNMQMSEFEKKSLAAASEAQKESGLGMHIHACLWNREGLNALKYAISCGANPEKVCVGHADVLLDEEYIMGVLDLGAYMEFDDFGKEFYVDRATRNLLLHSFATDVERVKTIKKLIEKGYKKQILISNDVCLKSMTHTYGGWGYDHVIKNIIPMMEDFGISDADINTIVTENPLRFLDR